MSSPQGPSNRGDEPRGDEPQWGQQPDYGSGGQGQQPPYGGYYDQPSPYGQPAQQPYGQPAQHYGGPYGQPYAPPPGQPGQTWQFPQGGAGYPPPSPPQPPKRSVLPRILLVLGVLLIVGVVLAVLVVQGVLGKTTFDNTAMQRDVKRILTENFGQKNVTAVSCPAGQEVKTGRTFTCTATIDGQQRQVTITVKTDSGDYEVGVPK